MATGGGGDPERPPDDLDLRHFCSLCMEPYKGRNPKILPCFHTFCLPCLTTLQASATTKTTESLKDQVEGQTDDVDNDIKSGNDTAKTLNGVFSCPTCRAQIPIPDGGMAKLQTNFYLDDDGRGRSTSPSVGLCDMCDVTNQQEVTHECRTCSRRMCNGCRRCHDALMPDHKVSPPSLSTGKPSGRKRNTPRNNCCLIHQEQRLCFYCRQCDVIICMHCKMTSHEGHVTVDMARDTSEYREEMTSLLTTAREQLQVSESALRRLDRDDRELTRYMQKMTQQVHARHDALMAFVLQSRDQLLDDVIAKEEEVRGQLRAEKTSVSITMETLTSLVSRAARVTSNDPDAMLLKKEIQAALHGEDRLSHLRKLADRHASAWRWRYDVTDADVLPPELVAAYMGHVVEGTDDDVMRMTPLSLREVSDRVDRWITDVTETTAMLKKADDDLQAKTTSLDNDVTDLKKVDADLQAQTTSLDNDVTAMKQAEAGLQTDVTSLKSTAESFSNKFDNMGNLFFAEYPDCLNTKQGQAIVYKNVTQYYDSFDAGTSTFTAPSVGLYTFWVYLTTYVREFKPTAHLMVNNTSRHVFEGEWGGKNFNENVCLSQGDSVWLKAVSPVHHYHYACSFSGYFACSCCF